jgi:hypothetical protein
VAVSSLVVAGIAMIAVPVAAVIIAVSAAAVIVPALWSAAMIWPPLAPDGGPPGRLRALPVLPLMERGAVVADRDSEKRPGNIGG